MPEKIYNRTTQFAQTKKEELKSFVLAGIDEAKIEWVMRSPFAYPNLTLAQQKNLQCEVSSAEAIELAKVYLTQEPTDPIFNNLIGADFLNQHLNFKVKFSPEELQNIENHLFTAWRERNRFPFGQDLISYKLARFYLLLLDNPMKGMVWFAKAIADGSTLAREEYLQKTFFDYLNAPIPYDFSINFPTARAHTPVTDIRYCLTGCTFLFVLLAGQHFPELEKTAWFSGWIDENKFLFAQSNTAIRYAPSQALVQCDEENSPIRQLMWLAIANCPKLFLDYFFYSFSEGLISGEVFSKLITTFIQMTSNPCDNEATKRISFDMVKKIITPELLNNAHYKLFIYYFYQKDWQKSKEHYHALPNSFHDFNVLDFEHHISFLTPDSANEISYVIFERLYQNKQFAEALVFLKNVNDAKYYEFNLFEFFDAGNYKTNYDAFKQKRECVRRILQTPNLSQALYGRATQDQPELINQHAMIQSALHQAIDLVHQYTQKLYFAYTQQSNLLQLFFTRESRLNFYADIARYKTKLTNDMYTSYEYTSWIETYRNTIALGEQLFNNNNKTDKTILKALAQAKSILEDKEVLQLIHSLPYHPHQYPTTPSMQQLATVYTTESTNQPFYQIPYAGALTFPMTPPPPSNEISYPNLNDEQNDSNRNTP